MTNQFAIAIAASIIFVIFMSLCGLIWKAERDSIRRHPGEDSEHGGRPL